MAYTMLSKLTLSPRPLWAYLPLCNAEVPRGKHGAGKDVQPRVRGALHPLATCFFIGKRIYPPVPDHLSIALLLFAH